MSATVPHNTLSDEPAAALVLVEIIELKWLLSGHGVMVHVERMQADREYARQTLDRAATTDNRALRAAALRLRQRLGIDAD